MVRRSLFLSALLAIAALSANASAALTTAEQAQLKGLAASGQAQNAGRVRAMVARPDLSLDESSAALKDALAGTLFSPAFVRELVFGGASAAARPQLVIATVRALIARAESLLGLGSPPPQALGELQRIYEFIDAEVANAGRPRGAEHDPQAGIPETSYDACAKAMAEHIEKYARFLRADAALTSSAATRVRAQAELATYDLIGDRATRRVDAADRLGLTGARRAILVDLGVLLIDSGKADAVRLDRVRALLDRLGSARADVTAIAFGDEHPQLRARGLVLGVQTPLEATTPPTTPLFPDDVNPGPTDASTVELARELSLVAVRRALDNRGELRLQAERDVAAAGGDERKLLGKPGDSLEATLASAVQLLITDAPRTLDVAFVRFLAGKSTPAALFSDALGVLASHAGSSENTGLFILLGKPKADGATEPMSATRVRLLPTGAVSSFALGGHQWLIRRDDSTGTVIDLQRDGAPIVLSMLPTARVPTTDATSWSGGGLVFAKLFGVPRAAIVAEKRPARVRLVGSGEKGFDAISIAAPSDDVSVESDLTVSGEAGIALRAAPGRDAFRGAALVLTPGMSPRVTLVQKEETGFESFLAAPVELTTFSGAAHVKMTVRKTKIEAVVTTGGSVYTLRGTLPANFAHGDVALCAKKPATLEATNFALARAR
jgi:hypothetical protein